MNPNFTLFISLQIKGGKQQTFVSSKVCTGSWRFVLTSQHLTVQSIEPLMAIDESSLYRTQFTVPA